MLLLLNYCFHFQYLSAITLTNILLFLHQFDTLIVLVMSEESHVSFCFAIIFFALDELISSYLSFIYGHKFLFPFVFLANKVHCFIFNENYMIPLMHLFHTVFLLNYLTYRKLETITLHKIMDISYMCVYIYIYNSKPSPYIRYVCLYVCVCYCWI